MNGQPPYAADPLNPTDEELAAAIQRGLANGTLIDAGEWLERQEKEAPMAYETWISPQGVAHSVPVIQDRGAVQEPVTGPCATCGKHHDVLHFRNVRVYADQYQHLPEGTRCATVVQDWPYECIAKDKHPDHVVYRCTAHGVWWHQAP